MSWIDHQLSAWLILRILPNLLHDMSSSQTFNIIVHYVKRYTQISFSTACNVHWWSLNLRCHRLIKIWLSLNQIRKTSLFFTKFSIIVFKTGNLTLFRQFLRIFSIKGRIFVKNRIFTYKVSKCCLLNLYVHLWFSLRPFLLCLWFWLQNWFQVVLGFGSRVRKVVLLLLLLFLLPLFIYNFLMLGQHIFKKAKLRLLS